MRFYDLFAGIGGFRLGLERNGFECVGGCEIDKHARQIYHKNFGQYPNEMDVTKIQPEQLPDFDILCAGFPCQPFSVAGRGKGFKDIRGTLFYHITRIAEEKQPPVLFLENVKGLLSNDNGNTFEAILKTLDGLGYSIEWQVINSKYFVPQNRERVYIIGHLRGKSRQPIFPLGENGKLPAEPEEPTSVRTITGGGHSGGLHSQMTLICHNHDGYAIRRLTPLECERLQGFPDGWTEGISNTNRYKCIGNAVTVNVVEYIGSHLKVL